MGTDYWSLELQILPLLQHGGPSSGKTACKELGISHMYKTACKLLRISHMYYSKQQSLTE